LLYYFFVVGNYQVVLQLYRKKVHQVFYYQMGYVIHLFLQNVKRINDNKSQRMNDLDKLGVRSQSSKTSQTKQRLMEAINADEGQTSLTIKIIAFSVLGFLILAECVIFQFNSWLINIMKKVTRLFLADAVDS
jgi:hypothetical protein